MMRKKGLLEVVCGSMFSGKSEELIRRLRRAEIAKQNVITIKHTIDDRRSNEFVTSHVGNKILAIELSNPKQILNFVNETTDIVGIDEVQFFDKEVVNVILQLVDEGKRVIVAGLDLDFRGVPFGCMPALLAFADKVTKLKAVCMECGKDAHFTQRIINNDPAKYDDPIILVGAQECYQARCRNCYKIDKTPFTLSERSESNGTHVQI
ncbi:MAG: thymidine kinase [Candidatus Babeliales bacterium]|nr:thymidine kinase [Candidatus Babeliales bacterium]